MPKQVDRTVRALKRKGMTEKQAWAIAMSQYKKSKSNKRKRRKRK